MPLKTLELIPAYVWDCEECGSENWQRSVSRFLRPDRPEEAAEIRLVNGLPPDAPLPPDLRFQVSTNPRRVACRRCKAVFRATPFDPDVPDDLGDDLPSGG